MTVASSSLANAFDFITAEHAYLVAPWRRAIWSALAFALLWNLSPRNEADLTDTDAPDSEDKTMLLALALVFAVGFTAITLCFAPAMYAMSIRPPPRALVTAQYVLACCAVSCGLLASLALKRLSLSEGVRRSALPLYLSVAVVIASAYVATSGSQITLAKSNKSRALAALWDRQDREISEARSQGRRDLTIPTIHYLTGTDLLTSDPQWYVNQCMSSYYGLDSIVGRPNPEALKIMAGDTSQ